jgi:16S rRNA (adenine1518-N6/adenine1519-N6)-dimethyltransferase
MPKKKISSSFQVKQSLLQFGIRAKKGLGQNFLIDKSVLETIVAAAALSPEDMVIEVGPGLGMLTTELAREAGNIVAVELDANLASQLKLKLSYLPNVTIINADILEVKLSDLIGEKDHYKVVANIPYYITSPILHYFIRAAPKPSLMVVMVQKEVGEAIVAKPGDMTVLSVTMQIFSKPSIISYVSPQSFYPSPKVDSAIVLFEMHPEPVVKVTDINSFLKFVRSGFRSPRKQLSNSLAQGLSMKPAEITSLLKAANIESKRRPETLHIEEWQTLYEVALSSDMVNLT